MKNLPQKNRRGYVGILLSIIVLILTIITTASVAIGISSLKGTTLLGSSEAVLSLAESGVDNAILRLLRDPSYVGETDLRIGSGNVTIEVSGAETYTILSTATQYQVVRTLRVTLTKVANSLTITNWEEI